MTITTQHNLVQNVAPEFTLYNHDHIAYRLTNMMGSNGVLLVFCANIWDLSSVRNVLWLHRQLYKLTLHGLNAVVIVPNHAHELNGFYMSIPRTIPFPLLADPDYQVYQQYHIEQGGFVLVDSNREIRGVWQPKFGGVPNIEDIVNAIGR